MARDVIARGFTWVVHEGPGGVRVVHGESKSGPQNVLGSSVGVLGRFSESQEAMHLKGVFLHGLHS